MEKDVGNDEVNYQHVTEKKRKGNAAVGKNMILLDNQYTCNVFYAGNLLRNIGKVNPYLTIHSNTGSTNTAWMGYLPGFGQLWSCKNGIATILSLFQSKEMVLS